jgi:hypothetical protein
MRNGMPTLPEERRSIRGVALQSPGLRQPVTHTPITTYSYDHRPTGGSYPKIYGTMVELDRADRSAWDAVVVYNRSRARLLMTPHYPDWIGLTPLSPAQHLLWRCTILSRRETDRNAAPASSPPPHPGAPRSRGHASPYRVALKQACL